MALQAGADANHKNRVCVRINVQQNSYTALHAAALNGHHALAQAPGRRGGRQRGKRCRSHTAVLGQGLWQARGGGAAPAARRRVRGHAVGRRSGRSHTAVLGQARGASRGGGAAPAVGAE